MKNEIKCNLLYSMSFCQCDSAQWLPHGTSSAGCLYSRWFRWCSFFAASSRCLPAFCASLWVLLRGSCCSQTRSHRARWRCYWRTLKEKVVQMIGQHSLDSPASHTRIQGVLTHFVRSRICSKSLLGNQNTVTRLPLQIIRVAHPIWSWLYSLSCISTRFRYSVSSNRLLNCWKESLRKDCFR